MSLIGAEEAINRLSSYPGNLRTLPPAQHHLFSFEFPNNLSSS